MTGKDETGAEERALIEQAKEDREAFGRLYEQHLDRIYNYIFYRTGNVADAEDLTARVFFRALQHIEGFEYQGVPFSAWLYHIARNLLANWYRDQSKRQMIPLEYVAQRQTREGPEAAVEKEEDRQALLAAIRRLPADRQELLILKHVEKLPNAEIGQILGRSEGAVKALYYRTLRALESELSPAAEAEPSDLKPGSDGGRVRRWLRFGKDSG